MSKQRSSSGASKRSFHDVTNMNQSNPTSNDKPSNDVPTKLAIDNSEDSVRSEQTADLDGENIMVSTNKDDKKPSMSDGVQESMQSSSDEDDVSVDDSTQQELASKDTTFPLGGTDFVYYPDVLQYFREREKTMGCVKERGGIGELFSCDESIREILVDFLVGISTEVGIQTESVHLAVSYVDRFMNQMSVDSSKVVLVAVTALYIACKYEEVWRPSAADFLRIIDPVYTMEELLNMELLMLNILEFNLSTPTLYSFITAYCAILQVSDNIKFLALYISELSLLKTKPFLRIYPSIISTASLSLAHYLSGLPMWSNELEEVTKYRLEEIREVVMSLSKHHKDAQESKRQSIPNKYRSDKNNAVACLKPNELTYDCFYQILSTYNQNNEP